MSDAEVLDELMERSRRNGRVEDVETMLAMGSGARQLLNLERRAERVAQGGAAPNRSNQGTDKGHDAGMLAEGLAPRYLSGEDLVLSGETELRIHVNGGYVELQHANRLRGMEFIEFAKRYLATEKVPREGFGPNVIIEAFNSSSSGRLTHAQIHAVDHEVVILLPTGSARVPLGTAAEAISARDRCREYLERHVVPAEPAGIESLVEEAGVFTPNPHDLE